MSAYIVEDVTINRIIAGIEFTDNWIKSQLGTKMDNYICRAELGNKMFKMNIRAIEERYGSGEAKEFRDLNYEYKQESPPSKIQLLKSLDCYLYQCSEGNVPESDLYKRLVKVKHALQSHIISRLPEYDKAQWA